jgi:hypothetical protein
MFEEPSRASDQGSSRELSLLTFGEAAAMFVFRRASGPGALLRFELCVLDVGRQPYLGVKRTLGLLLSF